MTVSAPLEMGEVKPRDTQAASQNLVSRVGKFAAAVFYTIMRNLSESLDCSIFVDAIDMYVPWVD